MALVPRGPGGSVGDGIVEVRQLKSWENWEGVDVGSVTFELDDEYILCN